MSFLKHHHQPYKHQTTLHNYELSLMVILASTYSLGYHHKWIHLVLVRGPPDPFGYNNKTHHIMVFISIIITNFVFYPTDICKEPKFIYLTIKSLSDQFQIIDYSIFFCRLLWWPEVYIRFNFLWWQLYLFLERMISKFLQIDLPWRQNMSLLRDYLLSYLVEELNL